jgi:hypothetical protein
MAIDLSNCPAREGFLPNDASGCHCFFTNEKKGVIDVSAATPYNTTYYKTSDCCNGYVNSREPNIFPQGFPINQRGRWNYNTTNTKLYRPNGLLVTVNNITARQSGNLFLNTHRRSKKKLFSYLSRHRIFLNR